MKEFQVCTWFRRETTMMPRLMFSMMFSLNSFSRFSSASWSSSRE